MTTQPYRTASFLSFLPWLVVLEVISLAIGYVASPNPGNPDIHQWYNALAKAPFNPPDWAFPIAWTLLYGLIAYALWRVWTYRKPRSYSYFAFALGHMILNWGWSFIFFVQQNVFNAFLWLNAVLFTGIALMLWTRRYDAKASLALVPYLLWLMFASALNFYILRAN
jgi:benzodiazapine receptor